MKLRFQMILCAMLGISVSYGAATVSYVASNAPDASPDANSNTVNIWATTASSGNNGYFSGSSASNGDGNGAGAGNPAWAMWAKNGAQSFAQYNFEGSALAVSQTVGLNFDNGYIDNGSSTGIQLRNGTTVLFSLYFRGGQSFYEYLDNGGSDIDTTRGFSDDGAAFSFTLNSATAYSASYGAANWTGTIANSSIDNIRVFNNNSGNGGQFDVYFNNLTVVPEPGAAALGVLGTALLLRRRR